MFTRIRASVVTMGLGVALVLLGGCASSEEARAAEAPSPAPAKPSAIDATKETMGEPHLALAERGPSVVEQEPSVEERPPSFAERGPAYEDPAVEEQGRGAPSDPAPPPPVYADWGMPFGPGEGVVGAGGFFGLGNDSEPGMEWGGGCVTRFGCVPAGAW